MTFDEGLRFLIGALVIVFALTLGFVIGTARVQAGNIKANAQITEDIHQLRLLYSRIDRKLGKLPVRNSND